MLRRAAPITGNLSRGRQGNPITRAAQVPVVKRTPRVTLPSAKVSGNFNTSSGVSKKALRGKITQ
jgi:hypothetical protein